MNKIIINKETLEVVSEASFRQLHSNVSFPVILSEGAIAEIDYILLQAPQQPNLLQYQTAELVVSKQGEDIVASYNTTTQLPPLNVLLKSYEEAIDNLIDSKAKEYNYSNVYTMISYRGDPNPKFNQEAESMFLWRSQVWTTVNTLLANYMGTIGDGVIDVNTLPTTASILDLLPPFVLLEIE